MAVAAQIGMFWRPGARDSRGGLVGSSPASPGPFHQGGGRFAYELKAQHKVAG